jgi:hypothetical protein
LLVLAVPVVVAMVPVVMASVSTVAFIIGLGGRTLLPSRRGTPVRVSRLVRVPGPIGRARQVERPIKRGLDNFLKFRGHILGKLFLPDIIDAEATNDVRLIDHWKALNSGKSPAKGLELIFPGLEGRNAGSRPIKRARRVALLGGFEHGLNTCDCSSLNVVEGDRLQGGTAANEIGKFLESGIADASKTDIDDLNRCVHECVKQRKDCVAGICSFRS